MVRGGLLDRLDYCHICEYHDLRRVLIDVQSLNIVQVIYDAKMDRELQKDVRNKRTVSGRVLHASGKIQRIFHVAALLCATLMPAKLLEVSDFDTWMLVALSRIPDMAVTLTTYVCFHCACYFTAFHAFLTERRFDSLPKWCIR